MHGPTTKLESLLVLGLLFLSYPLFGYIADVCLTRYRTLKCSLVFLIVGSTIGLILLLVSFFISFIEISVEKRSIFNEGNILYC